MQVCEAPEQQEDFGRQQRREKVRELVSFIRCQLASGVKPASFMLVELHSNGIPCSEIDALCELKEGTAKQAVVADWYEKKMSANRSLREVG